MRSNDNSTVCQSSFNKSRTGSGIFICMARSRFLRNGVIFASFPVNSVHRGAQDLNQAHVPIKSFDPLRGTPPGCLPVVVPFQNLRPRIYPEFVFGKRQMINTVFANINVQSIATFLAINFISHLLLIRYSDLALWARKLKT